MKKNFNYILIVCFSATGFSCLAQHNKTNGERINIIDSLLNITKVGKKDTSRVNSLNRLSWELKNAGEYDRAKPFADTALSLSEKLRYQKGIVDAENNLGIIYRNKGEYPHALEFFFKALKIDEGKKDKMGMAKRLGNIATVYNEQRNFTPALEFNFKALKLREKLKDKSGMAIVLGNIGVTYDEEAKQFGLDSLFKKSLYYHSKALEIDEELGNKLGIERHLGNIANVYSQKGFFSDAIIYYLKAVKIAQELNDRRGMAMNTGNIGVLYSHQKMSVKALEYCSKGLSLAIPLGNKQLISDAYSNLTTIYEETHDYSNALRCYKFFITYKDSLNNEENTKKQTRTEMQYTFDKQLSADSIKNMEHAKQEKLNHDQEIQQQKIYTYGGAIGFLLMMVVAGVSFRAYRQKQNANEVITLQKVLVEQKQKEILDSIHYAKRIQRSLLPAEKYIDRNMKRLKKK